ncbi:MAG: hypothetical protein V3581_03730, partial [Candidatus Cardinium sp.]
VKRFFSYATLLSFIIQVFVISVGLFVFVGSPNLPKEAIWEYVILHIPTYFIGFLAVGFLAMTMSTTDSCLNACAIMVRHDILRIIRKKKEMVDSFQLKIARRTTLAVGLLAMMLAFRYKNLLTLFYWSIDSIVPIIAAPFILAIFGFRGTSRTALIGMVTGTLTILSWNKWVEPSTTIDGSFIAAVANGLAMLAAHYLLKQPESAGWVGPDDTFKQIQQENVRKRAERKEAIKNSWANKKITLSKLVPTHTTIVYIGLYTTITSLLAYFTICITHYTSGLIFQLFVAACFIGYPSLYDTSKRIREIPKWVIGLCWLIWLVVYLPKDLIWHWWNLVDPIFTISLFLTHCAVILWSLPLYLGIVIVATTSIVSMCPIVIGLPLQVIYTMVPMFIAILFVFFTIIYFKVKQGGYIAQVIYLKNQEKIRQSQQLKASLYDAASVPSVTINKAQGYGTILEQVAHKIEESMSFLDDDTTLYKKDFQSIINKLYDWIAYFNRREKAKNHSLLQPTKITLDKMIRQVEIALSQEVVDPPKLLVEQVKDPSGKLCPYITCHINQVVYLLVQAVLRIGKLEQSSTPVIRIQLHPTVLQFTQVDPIDNSFPISIDFSATALVISQVSASADLLPKVKRIMLMYKMLPPINVNKHRLHR